MNTMNIFTFDQDTIKDLEPGTVFLFYTKTPIVDGDRTEDGWNSKMMIFQGFAPGNSVRLVFNAADKSCYEAPNLETLSNKICVKLSSDQHPEVVQSGLSYVFSA